MNIAMILITIILLFSCGSKKEYPVVLWKSHLTYMSNAMPKDICRYGLTYDVEFDDSCSKYNVGDTIVGKRKF